MYMYLYNSIWTCTCVHVTMYPTAERDEQALWKPQHNSFGINPATPPVSPIYPWAVYMYIIPIPTHHSCTLNSAQ